MFCFALNPRSLLTACNTAPRPRPSPPSLPPFLPSNLPNILTNPKSIAFELSACRSLARSLALLQVPALMNSRRLTDLQLPRRPLGGRKAWLDADKGLVTSVKLARGRREGPK